MERATAWQRLRTVVRGDDVFISYARRDGTKYTAALAERLTRDSRRSLFVYFDHRGTPPNPRVPEEVLDRVRRAAVFVLVVSPAAARSAAVREEVLAAKAANVPIIPISFDATYRTDDIWTDVVGIAREVEPADALDAARPSDAVIERIVALDGYLSRLQMLRRIFAATALVVLGTAAAAIYTSADAVRSQRDAEQARVDAASATSVATRERAEAARLAALSLARQRAQESLRSRGCRAVLLAEEAHRANERARGDALADVDAALRRALSDWIDNELDITGDDRPMRYDAVSANGAFAVATLTSSDASRLYGRRVRARLEEKRVVVERQSVRGDVFAVSAAGDIASAERQGGRRPSRHGLPPNGPALAPTVLRVYGATGATLTATVTTASDVLTVSISDDGRVVLLADAFGTSYVAVRTSTLRIRALRAAHDFEMPPGVLARSGARVVQLSHLSRRGDTIDLHVDVWDLAGELPERPRRVLVRGWATRRDLEVAGGDSMPLAVSPSGRLLAVPSFDAGGAARAFIYDLAPPSPHAVGTVRARGRRFASATFSGDERRVALGTALWSEEGKREDASVVVALVDGGSATTFETGLEDTSLLEFAPDGRTVFAAEEGHLWIFDPGGGRTLELPVDALQARGDSMLVFAGGGVTTWKRGPARPIVLEDDCIAESTSYEAVAVSGETVVAAAHERLDLWSDDHTIARSLAIPDMSGRALTALDRGYVAVLRSVMTVRAEDDRREHHEEILRLDLATGSTATVAALRGAIQTVAYDHGTRRLTILAKAELRGAWAWLVSENHLDTATATVTIVSPVTHSFTRGGELLLLQADGRIVQRRGDAEEVLGEHTDAVDAAALDPSGRWLATSVDRGTVQVWDLERGGSPAFLAELEGPVAGLSFSPDGKWIYSVAPAHWRGQQYADRVDSAPVRTEPPQMYKRLTPAGLAAEPSPIWRCPAGWRRRAESTAIP